jgi:hypothetical protein
MTSIKTEGIFDVTLSGVIEKSTTPLTRKELFSKYKFITEDALNEGNGNTISNWDLVAYLLPDND